MRKLIVLIFCSFLFLTGGVAQKHPHTGKPHTIDREDVWRPQHELIDKLEYLNNKISILDEILEKEQKE